MEPWQIAIVLKPLGALLLFGVIVPPIGWLIRRGLPPGDFKTFLFKDRADPYLSSPRDRALMTGSVIFSYACLFAFLGWLAR